MRQAGVLRTSLPPAPFRGHAVMGRPWPARLSRLPAAHPPTRRLRSAWRLDVALCGAWTTAHQDQNQKPGFTLSRSSPACRRRRPQNRRRRQAGLLRMICGAFVGARLPGTAASRSPPPASRAATDDLRRFCRSALARDGGFKIAPAGKPCCYGGVSSRMTGTHPCGIRFFPLPSPKLYPCAADNAVKRRLAAPKVAGADVK